MTTPTIGVGVNEGRLDHNCLLICEPIARLLGFQAISKMYYDCILY